MAAYGALVSLMHILDNLENHPRPPISLEKKQVDILTQKITFLQEFLEGYNPLVGYSAEAVLLESRITDAAYAAEDVIESHIVDSVIEVKSRHGRKARNRKPLSSDASVYQALETVIEDMTLIQKEAVEITQTTVSMGVQHQLHSKSTSPDSLGSSSSPSSAAQQSGMVGADDVLLQMKDKLRSDCLALQIIPIVGMAGLGKTTLARNIYQDPLITEHFHFRAWATISQEYSIREILVQLLKQLDKEVGKDSSEGELGDMLHRHLFGRRYLVILDDMWNIGAWEGVKMFLPNNKNGSRIVVTTRLSNLASKLPNSNSLEIKLLDDAKSWDLLTRTVYGDKDCPVELQGIGKKIAKSCKGLPLSIIVVGGLLAKSNRRREFWEHIEKNINSIVNSEDNERCLKILGMSYKHLPVYLKPCFLFMEVFVEDEVIRVSRLIKLWVAEGVVKPVRGKNLEERAKEYLDDLVGRNLIMIHELGCIGTIKYCKIHDLVRDLCLREAQRDRSYTSSQRRRMVISSTLSRTVALEYRSRRSMSVVRTLMWHLGNGIPTPHNFRLLRILDVCGAQSWRLSEDQSDDFLYNMCQLVSSRFLSYTISKDRSLHDSVWRFWNLQTIIAYESIQEYPPPEIWSMPHIRHVKIRHGLSLPDPPDDNIVLGSLQTLGTLLDFKCNREVAKRIPNIKKLVLNYRSLDCDRSCLGNLYSLSKLESFTCVVGFKVINGSLINFPHSLKKVTLSMDTDNYWEEILDKIGELPLLQKLKLSWGSFKGGQWETSEGQFCSLRSLAISFSRGLRVLKIESSHFPCLERLRLHEVDKLEEIPLEFADISTLRVVKVDYCSDPVVVSAKRILEEQEDLYGEEAALHVQVRLSDYFNNDIAALESLASPNFHVRSIA